MHTSPRIPVPNGFSRRTLLLGSAALALSACGADDSSGTDVSASGDGFPVTVEHTFGTATVKSEPKRIVVVGLTEQDTLLALGHVPIATTEWYGEEPYAVWPWAKEKLGDAKPTVLKQTDGIEFEKIAALRPDLIIGTNSGMSEDDYKKLSKLAPTVAMPKGGTQYFSPWDVQTVLVAKAVGKESEGKKLVADVKAGYADVAKKHPEFAGKTATFAQGAPYEGVLYVYQDGLNTQFLTYLGFDITPGLEKYSKEKGTQAQISAENLDVIDADVIVFATDSDEELGKLKAVETYRNLAAVEGRQSVYTGHVLAGAIYFMTPLSLQYALDKLVPQLEAAVNGTAPQAIVTA